MNILITIIFLILALIGCQKEKPNIDKKEPVDSSIYKQRDIKEPKELDISNDGNLRIEAEGLAKPDNTIAQDKSFFLVVTAKEDVDISVQYTYDTYSKEGALFCCDLKNNDNNEIKLEPLYSTYLPQSSEESYKEIWKTTGMFLKKGENIFYLNGKDQTFPYRMILEITFFDPEKIEKVTLYPTEL